MNRIVYRILAPFTLAAVTLLSAQTPKPAAAHPALLDINTATPEQLIALPGIGRAYAQRIVDGRPYTAKNQLLTRGILPETAYEKIAPRIVAKKIPKP
jgi:competence protein ComEA